MENSPGKDTDIILGGGLAPFVNYDLIDEDQKTRFTLTNCSMHVHCAVPVRTVLYCSQKLHFINSVISHLMKCKIYFKYYI